MPDEFNERVGTMSAHHARNHDSVAPAPGVPQDWTAAVSSARCWAQNGDAFFPVSQVIKKLPAGAYRCKHSNQGPFMEKMPILIDSLLTLPDSAAEMLLQEFEKFWTLKANFDVRGFTFKRGMLLWGPPGSGKTSAIWQMTKHLVQKQNGIVVFVEEPELSMICIHMLRRIEPNRPLICVFEDIDALVQRHGEHSYLALLDGEVQINNVIHIATTNYPEYLDRRFVDRPSRFDTIMKIGMPSPDAREAYFKAKEPGLSPETLERWVERTDGYSVAHLREVIIASQCFEQDEDAVFERLDKMRQAKLESNAFEDKGGFGFRNAASAQRIGGYAAR